MGSIKVESLDYQQLFKPSNINYPVQVFIAVIEHSAQTGSFNSDLDLIDYAVSQLDTSEIHRSKIEQLKNLTSWADFKADLTYTYEKKLTFAQKLEMFQSLNKQLDEDSFHYLFRVQYAASLIKESVSCACKETSINVEEWAKILFLAGLDPTDQDTCRYEADLSSMASILGFSAIEVDIDNHMMVENDYYEEDTEEKPLLSELDEPKRPKMEWNELITEAIANSESQVLTFEDICKSITDTHPFFARNTYSSKKPEMKLQIKHKLCEGRLFLQVKKPGSDIPMWALKVVKEDNEDRDPATEKTDTSSTYTVKGGVYSCNQCEVKATTRQKMLRHVVTHVFSEEQIRHCDHCDFKTKNDKTFAQHTANWCSPVKCASCDFQTRSKQLMTTHRKSKHGEKKKFICEHCQKVFTSKRAQEDHVESYHLGIKRFHCEVENCDFACYREKALKYHMEMHTGLKTFRCEVCGQGFNRKNNFLRHQESHKSAEDRIIFGCLEPGCDSTFSQKGNLKLHVQKVHQREMTDFRTLTVKESGKTHYGKERLRSEQPRTSCNIPNTHLENFTVERLINEGKLKVVELRDKEELTGITEEGVFEAMITSGNLSSLTEIEFEEKVYHCGSCNRSFGQKHKGLVVDHIINDHNVAYSGCKLYQCRVDPKSCSFSAYQKFRFRHHMNNKHSYRTETENLCKMCNKSFKYLYTLKSHIKQVHQETEKRFQCDECGYLSKTMQRARRHFRTHKPLDKRLDYACDQCERKFTEKSHLYTHIRIVHLKIKEFRCKFCNTTFSLTCNLEEHIAIKHMGFKNGKEWRVARKDPLVKNAAKEHEAFEYTKQDTEKLWSEVQSK